jgi:hypothetical protein
MTMMFRTVAASIVDILGDAAADRFTVVGYKPRALSADEVKDDLRTVQVFYTEGEFPKSSAGSLGPLNHDLTFKIDLSVASASKGDLASLSNPDSTGPQFVAALESFQEASDLANASLDELIDIVFNILMDGRNLDLGLETGYVANRWIKNVTKQGPLPRGEYVVISGSMDLTCGVAEEILGDPGVAADPDLGAVYAELEINMPDSEDPDEAKAAVRGGGI